MLDKLLSVTVSFGTTTSHCSLNAVILDLLALAQSYYVFISLVMCRCTAVWVVPAAKLLTFIPGQSL